MQIHAFIIESIHQMKEVAAKVGDMDIERKQVLLAVKTIHECSEQSVKAVTTVEDTLKRQVLCAETLNVEAEVLKTHMQQLEEVIAAFRLE